MFADIILTVIIFGLFIERYMAENRWSHERVQLLNRIIAKTPSEVRILDAPKGPVYREKDPLRELDGFEGIAGLS